MPIIKFELQKALLFNNNDIDHLGVKWDCQCFFCMWRNVHTLVQVQDNQETTFLRNRKKKKTIQAQSGFQEKTAIQKPQRKMWLEWVVVCTENILLAPKIYKDNITAVLIMF